MEGKVEAGISTFSKNCKKSDSSTINLVKISESTFIWYYLISRKLNSFEPSIESRNCAVERLILKVKCGISSCAMFFSPENVNLLSF